MTQELYINGERCDLYDKEPIPLIFDSPFFTDINKIVSNRTHSVKIPKTANNLRLIQFSHRTDNDSKFPYKRHVADYYLNGMEIIRNGCAVLWSIAEDIEIQLVWGNISAFKELLDMESLREIYTPKTLPDNETIPQPDPDEAVLLWPKENGEFWSGTSKEDRPGPYFWAKIDYGLGTTIKKNPQDKNEKGVSMEYFRPVVTAGWILDRLAEYKKIKFDIPSTTREAIDDLVFPLFSKNGSNTNWLSHYASGEIDEKSAKEQLDRDGSDGSFMVAMDRTNEVEGDVVGEWADFPLHLLGTYTGYECLHAGQCHIKVKIALQTYFCTGLTLEIIKSGVVCVTREAELECDVLTIKLNHKEEVSNVDSITFRLILKNYRGSGTNFTQKSFFVVIEPTETVLGSNYPILPNLPDMAPSAFLKLLMQITGTFPYVKEGHSDTIHFTSIDTLYQNVKMRNAVDWTRKVLMHSRYSNDPSQMEFKYGSFAQKNRCLWKEDKKIEVDASGYLTVDSEHLEKEKDLLKLELTATEMKDGVAFIPMFTTESDGKIKENEMKTRVLVSGIKEIPNIGAESLPFFQLTDKDIDSNFHLIFDGENGLINRFYSKYQKIIKTPKVIQIKCLLNEYDISILDLTVPIYFEQFGQYYVILKIQSNNGISDCELLEIDESIV